MERQSKLLFPPPPGYCPGPRTRAPPQRAARTRRWGSAACPCGSSSGSARTPPGACSGNEYLAMVSKATRLELETKVCEDFTITEKTPTLSLFSLKVLTSNSTFTSKTLVITVQNGPKQGV